MDWGCRMKIFINGKRYGKKKKKRQLKKEYRKSFDKVGTLIKCDDGVNDATYYPRILSDEEQKIIYNNLMKKHNIS